MDIAAYEKGGPNDPIFVFDSLRRVLTLVKEELSPWGWRAFSMEFRERQKAEKKLQALNGLPGSGAEPKDGVVNGTPLWQERLDKMLLVEHLKRKLMTAHGEFAEASELVLKSHAWLAKEAKLADSFVVSITHVPPAKSERLDLLQIALTKSRKETQDMRDAFEDFKIQLKILREKYIQRTMAHQDIALRRKLCDDIVVLWSFEAQRSTAVRLTQIRRVLETRILSLETAFAARTEELEETQRQWNEEKEALTADRDRYKKMYTRMVKAHEQAMEDLKNSQGSVEDQAKMIQVLSMEKHRLTQACQDLEDDKRRMIKQMADLRDEVAKLRQETERYVRLLRDGETALVEARRQSASLEDTIGEMEALLDEAAVLEATLRDELLVTQGEVRGVSARLSRSLAEVAKEEWLRRSVEGERDVLLQQLRLMEDRTVKALVEAKETTEAVIERARWELEEFKNSEIAAVKEEFRRKTEAIIRRNAQLEKEVAVGDAVAPHLAVLNPLAVDESRLCSSCRKAIIFEGIIKER